MKKEDLSVYIKKSSEELQEYLNFKRKGSKIKSKKGKGSFKRNKKVEEYE